MSTWPQYWKSTSVIRGSNDAGLSLKELQREYRRLRRRLATAGSHQSLEVIHAYFAYFEFGRPLPDWIMRIPQFEQVGILQHMLLPWELDILCRELIVSGSHFGTTTLAEWDFLAECINIIKNIQGIILRTYPQHFAKNIKNEIFRMGNQQFPSQKQQYIRDIIRYIKIFGTKEISNIISEKIGISYETIVLIGMILLGHFMDEMTCPLPLQFEHGFGVNESELIAFLKWLSTAPGELHDREGPEALINENFLYELSPLVETPLLIFPGQASRYQIACPIPSHFIRRFTQGIYYDICREKHFDNLFGNSFQEYVGEVVDEVSDLKVIGEKQYSVGKNKKNTIDWIIWDGTASLFVECKTKRISLRAKTLIEEREHFDKDFAIMTEAIVQTYKSLSDAKMGFYPSWKCDGKPIYPLVVTLEEWFALPIFYNELRTAAGGRLEEEGIGAAILQEHPFTVASVSEMETALQVMDRVSIEQVMNKKTKKQYIDYGLDAFIRNVFPAECEDAKVLIFQKEWVRIHPYFADEASRP